MFYLILISIFLTIFIEASFFYLQLKNRYMEKIFGNYAFLFHSVITIFFWLVTHVLIFIFMFQTHPKFHDFLPLTILGVVILIFGLIISTWGFKILGLKRSLGINFYQKDSDDYERVDSSIYKFIKNPQENGYILMLIGFALVTNSLYNLIFALLFLILMIPHQKIENLIFKRQEV